MTLAIQLCMTLKTMTEAKAVRDTVRNEIVRTLATLENLPAELLALLAADKFATEGLREAVTQFEEAEACR